MKNNNNNNNNCTFFLSHTWKYDKQNRNTHRRVMCIKSELEKLGHSTWFDDDKIIHDIDGSMAHGVDNCSAIIIFITKKYNLKVIRGSQYPRFIDNCHKECVYAVNSGKSCIPVIFENCMLDIKTWQNGVLKLYFGNKLYVDGTSNDYKVIANNIIKLFERTSQRVNEIETSNSFEISSPSSTSSPYNKKNYSINNLVFKSPIKIMNNKFTKAMQPSRCAPILPNIKTRDKSCQTMKYNYKRNIFSNIVKKIC